MKDWTPVKFIELIDKKFLECKRKGCSRYDTEWGGWSREMNLVLRERIESGKDAYEMSLKFVVVYWMAKSQILEFYFKGRYLHVGKRKKAEAEAEGIRKLLTRHSERWAEVKKALLESTT